MPYSVTLIDNLLAVKLITAFDNHKRIYSYVRIHRLKTFSTGVDSSTPAKKDFVRKLDCPLGPLALVFVLPQILRSSKRHGTVIK